MRALEFVQENKQATAQQVLSYIDQTHHEKLIPKLVDAVSSYPRWELRQVPLRNLYIPDQDYEDPEQEPLQDPYGRVMAIDPDHANEYSTKVIDQHPIVIDDQGYIIDGNHRAWAAAELMNRNSIPAWVPVKQSMAENFTKSTTEFGGLEFKIKQLDSADSEHAGFILTALDPTRSKELGYVVFADLDNNELAPRDLAVYERYQGQGIAKTMYDYVKSLGYTIHRSSDQTDAGRGFWDKNRGEEATVWENFADGKKPGRKGLSKRVGIPKKASLTQLQKIASSSTGERRRMAQWQLNMRRGKAKKK